MLPFPVREKLAHVASGRRRPCNSSDIPRPTRPTRPTRPSCNRSTTRRPRNCNTPRPTNTCTRPRCNRPRCNRPRCSRPTTNCNRRPNCKRTCRRPGTCTRPRCATTPCTTTPIKRSSGSGLTTNLLNVFLNKLNIRGFCLNGANGTITRLLLALIN